MFLALAGVHGDGEAVRPRGGVQGGVLVHVLHQQGGADGGSVVQAGAPVSVPACSCRHPARAQGQRLGLRWAPGQAPGRAQGCLEVAGHRPSGLGCRRGAWGVWAMVDGAPGQTLQVLAAKLQRQAASGECWAGDEWEMD